MKINLKRGYSVDVGEEKQNVNSIDVIGNYSKSNYQATAIVNKNGIAPTVRENHGQVTGIVMKEEKMDDLIIGDNKLKVDEYPSIVQKSGDRGGNNYTKNNISYTIPVNAMSDRGQLLVENKLRIRKLTPKECWRLMGFDDSDFEKAEKVNSNTQLYKQAGNSIVVNVLERILENLLKDSEYFDKNNNRTK